METLPAPAAKKAGADLRSLQLIAFAWFKEVAGLLREVRPDEAPLCSADLGWASGRKQTGSGRNPESSALALPCPVPAADSAALTGMPAHNQQLNKGPGTRGAGVLPGGKEGAEDISVAPCHRIPGSGCLATLPPFLGSLPEPSAQVWPVFPPPAGCVVAKGPFPPLKSSLSTPMPSWVTTP